MKLRQAVSYATACEDRKENIPSTKDPGIVTETGILPDQSTDTSVRIGLELTGVEATVDSHVRIHDQMCLQRLTSPL